MIIKFQSISFLFLSSTLFYIFDLLVTLLIWYIDLWFPVLNLCDITWIFQFILSFGQFSRYHTHLKSGQTWPVFSPSRHIQSGLLWDVIWVGCTGSMPPERAMVSTGQAPSTAFQMFPVISQALPSRRLNTMCWAQWEGLGTIKSNLIIMITILYPYSFCIHVPLFIQLHSYLPVIACVN